MPSDGGDPHMPTADAAGGDAGSYVNAMDATTLPFDAGDASASPPIPVEDAGEPDAGRSSSSTDAGSSMSQPDASSDAAVDAGAVSDASTDAVPDAGTSPERICAAGKQLGGYCWLLGTVSQSCNTLCAAHGGYEPSLSWIGTTAQGGTLARCDALLTLLQGVEANTTAGRRTDGRGVGCHVFEGRRWWLTEPDFSPSASHWKAQIVCSCFDL